MPQVPQTTILPVIEERAVVGVRRVVTGRVRVSTVTETVDSHVPAALSRETLDVTRVPIGRVVDTVPETRVEGDVTIIPVVEETLVVQTRLVLREELHVRRRSTVEQVDVPVTLRRQRVVVERTDHATGALVLQDEIPIMEQTDE